jgi:DNA adenine methylase
MWIPHPIPYQGSKRWIAKALLDCFPRHVGTLFEPFAGSAAVTLAAACNERAGRFVISDINPALVRLWMKIISNPSGLADEYELLWWQQMGRESAFFNEVRERFNRTHEPGDFLYLLARCTKAAVRYNRNGQFNNSPDHRRKGTRPETMREHVLAVSAILGDKATIKACDFREALVEATSRDLVYMDPPYQGVCQRRDERYLKGLPFGEFVEALSDLNDRGIPFIVSYDGRTGEKTHGQPLPRSLELTHLEVVAGRSTTETLLGRSGITVESIYLSKGLMRRIHSVPKSLLPRKEKPKLFEVKA